MPDVEPARVLHSDPGLRRARERQTPHRVLGREHLRANLVRLLEVALVLFLVTLISVLP